MMTFSPLTRASHRPDSATAVLDPLATTVSDDSVDYRRTEEKYSDGRSLVAFESNSGYIARNLEVLQAERLNT